MSRACDVGAGEGAGDDSDDENDSMGADLNEQPFFGAMGCTSAIVFTCFGAAYGTAKAGVGISSMGVLRPDLIVKSTSIIKKAGVHALLRQALPIGNMD
jgi:hypothetical protein